MDLPRCTTACRRSSSQAIPARHDLARRIDAGFLARLVSEHRLELDEAIETASDLAYRLPKASYSPLS